MRQPRLQLRPWPLIEVDFSGAVDEGDGLVQPTGRLQLAGGEPQPGRDAAECFRRQCRGEDRQCRRDLRLVERVDDAGGIVPGGVCCRRAVRRRHLGQHLAGQFCLHEQFERPPPARPCHDGPQLRRDSLGAHGGHQVRHADDRRLCLLLQSKAKPCGKPHRAEHAEVIFAKSHRGVPDGPDDPRGEVGPAVDVVVHLAGDGIEKQSVDREVAPQGILAGVCEGHAGRVPAVGVGRVAAKRSHLHLPRAAGAEHGDHAEGGPYSEGMAVAKHCAHLIGAGRRRHVVVGRRAAEQFIANAAACPDRLVPRRP